MREPQDHEVNDLVDEYDSSYEESADQLTFDQWGNEWDSGNDFTGMDFRLVDDEY